jgi:hypothetical protein
MLDCPHSIEKKTGYEVPEAIVVTAEKFHSKSSAAASTKAFGAAPFFASILVST